MVDAVGVVIVFAAGVGVGVDGGGGARSKRQHPALRVWSVRLVSSDAVPSWRKANALPWRPNCETLKKRCPRRGTRYIGALQKTNRSADRMMRARVCRGHQRVNWRVCVQNQSWQVEALRDAMAGLEDSNSSLRAKLDLGNMLAQVRRLFPRRWYTCAEVRTRNFVHVRD